MKKIILSSRNRIIAILLILLTKGQAFAQTSLGDPSESTDKKSPPTHVLLQMSILALVLILVFYAGYRYWRTKRGINREASGGQL